MPRIIGIDLDNTLITYDKAFYQAAFGAGWIRADLPVCKRNVRDAVRLLANGELKWQQLQARIYGPEINRAEPMDGAIDFLKGCKDRGYECHIISHKPQFAAADPGGCDLCEAALTWLCAEGFLSNDVTGLGLDAVCFTDTRREKLAMIDERGCDCFIDDLLDVLLGPEFPGQVEKLWLAPNDERNPSNVVRFDTWMQIQEYVCSSEH